MSGNASKPNEQSAQSKEGVFSLEDLDKIIEAEDPSFNAQMQDLKTVAADATPLATELDIKTDDDELIKEEDPDKLSRIKKLKNKILKPLYLLPGKIWLRILALKNRGMLLLYGIKNFFQHDFVEWLKYVLSRGKAGFAYVKSLLLQFKAMSLLQKVTTVSLMAISLSALLFLGYAVLGRGLPRWSRDLPLSLANSATVVGSYQKDNELQDFYQAFPEVEFYVLMSKIVVNLKPSEGTGENPMGAFEIYLGLDSQDTAIEVKDREREILDIMQRTIEGFEYEVVVTKIGKIRMKTAIQDAVNNVLNQGYVFNVYFNLFITYH